jgi:type VI protein secretion system component VasF
VVGDFLSVFFRSNSRNAALINRWKSGEQKTLRRGSRFVLVGMLILLAALLAAWFFFWITVFVWVWRHITG